MTTYTGIADASGNFTINIGSALTSGEIVQVTAQKDGQSKSINIQAPSEPYLPPSSGGSSGEDEHRISNIHIPYYILRAVCENRMTLLTVREGLTENTIDNITYLRNTKFKKDHGYLCAHYIYFPWSFLDPIEYRTIFFSFNVGTVNSDGSFSFASSDQTVSQATVDGVIGLSYFTANDVGLYFVMDFPIYFDSSLNANTEDTKVFKVNLNGVTKYYVLNPNYSEV